MAKTIEQINEKIKKREAVVLTAEEMIDYVAQNGTGRAAEKVDVVTTGTFGPMCSSGAYFNIRQPKARIKIGGGYCALNNVPAYAGYAAADIFIGCTMASEDDPKNKMYPGEFLYGGAHVIEDFAAGKDIELSARAYGTDCYPNKALQTVINKQNVNNAVLFNPRNAYQNYNVAVNLSDKNIHTYMGTLKAGLGNANYCSAGQLSPLLNDPEFRTIGIGTRIFLGGTEGYVIWQGTQHNPNPPRTEQGVPKVPAGTIAVIGDLKEMTSDWVRGVSMAGYGVTLMLGLGIPIPVLDEEMAAFTAVKDADIPAPIIDYSEDYPHSTGRKLGETTYAHLRSGSIMLNGKTVKTASLSSYPGARKIAGILKQWIEAGDFLLSSPVAPIPGPESN